MCSCFSLNFSICVPLFRQQYAQALAQQKAAALSSAPVQQQQQHQQQINLLLQQYQALKIRLIIYTILHHVYSKYICTCASVFRTLTSNTLL